jgi:ribosomal protein S18 acetylase RimI-like enzyme
LTKYEFLLKLKKVNIMDKINNNGLNVLIKELDTKDNFSELFELSKDFFYEYEGHNKEYFKIDKLVEDDINNYFKRFIGNNESIAYIAKMDDKIIGYITLYIKYQANFMEIKEIGDISGLMVNKKKKKNGIGRKLIDKSKKYFKKNNIKYYTLFTSVKNEEAIRLYKKNGMDEIYITLLGKII